MVKIVYHKNKVWDIFHKKKFRINRTAKQRWHFVRISITQLFEHERIKVPARRAYHLKPTAQHVVNLARRFLRTENEAHFRMVQHYLTSEYAINRLFKEIIPRLENKPGAAIVIKKINHIRKGDNTQMGYIEVRGNEISEYEKTMKKDEAEKNPLLRKKPWQVKLLHQELEMFQTKLKNTKDQLDEVDLNNVNEKVETADEVIDAIKNRRCLTDMERFYQRRINNCEHELYNLTKSKYDRIRYAAWY